MITLLYHARAIGPICKRIARLSEGKIQAVCDRGTIPTLDTVIRWDSRVEASATKTVNSAAAVKLSRNKSASRVKLGNIAPTTWFRLEALTFPCLIRPRRHYAAQKFFVCKNLIEAKTAVRRCGKDWYASPIIDKKLEYRIFVFQGKVIKAVRRFHNDPKQVAWNIANGGRSVRLLKESWPKESLVVAIEAGKRLNLGWYAADVIVDQNDKPFVLELNTAPGLDRDETIELCAKVFAK